MIRVFIASSRIGNMSSIRRKKLRSIQSALAQ